MSTTDVQVVHYSKYYIRRKKGAGSTVKMNHRYLSNFQASKLSKNEQISFHTDILLDLQWKNKRHMHMISTIHGTEMVTTEKANYQTDRQIVKPIPVKDYNKNKWLVDKSDMHMSFSESPRKSFKWYKKFFFHLLDTYLALRCLRTIQAAN